MLAWPPPLNDRNSINFGKHDDAIGWVNWYFVLREDAEGQRVAIGNGGFNGKPTGDGMVEVGYSILEEFQRAGYATEAVSGLLKWLFSHDNVTRVIAKTYPTLKSSIRVMEKNRFVLIGNGSGEGVIRYELNRSAFQRSALH